MNRKTLRLALLGSLAALAAGSLAPAAVARTGQPRSGPYSWSALGDSYTAGVIKAAGNEFEFPRDGCARTDLSYPEVIARDLGPTVDLTNVSCGNAKIENITTVGQYPIGHEVPGLSTDPDYPFPQVPIQLDAVHPDTDVVTVGIGGNSLGFGDILVTCLALGQETGDRGTPCKDADTNAPVGESIHERLVELGAEYAEMLEAIRAKAPHAAIITVGYPTIVPNDTAKCVFGSLVGFSTITRGDLNWLRTDVLEPLNAVIKHQTDAAGDTYVDIYTSSQGHSVCDKAGDQNWVDGIFSKLLPPQIALVHPNAKGQANAAVQVEAAMRQALGI